MLKTAIITLLFLGANVLEMCVGIPLLQKHAKNVEDGEGETDLGDVSEAEKGAEQETDVESDEESDVAVEGGASHKEQFDTQSGSAECQIRTGYGVDPNDGDNYEQQLFVRSASDCQSRCNTDYRCEAFTWWDRRMGPWGTGTYVPKFTCALFKKKTEDLQWHTPVKFKAAQHLQSGYPSRHCQACGQRENSKKYRGKQLQKLTGINTWQKCQDQCERNSSCRTFSYNHAQWNGNFGVCLLKTHTKHNGAWDSAWSSGVPCSFPSGPAQPSWPR